MRKLFFLLALALWPLSVFAAGRTDWTSGNGAGAPGWTAAFNATDFTGAQPANGQTVLSTITILNGTSLDQFMDFSFIQTIGSNVVPIAANISIWIVPLAADGSTYTPAMTAGTASSNALPSLPSCVIPLFQNGGTQTTISGTCVGMIIPPGTFKIAEQNNGGWTYTNTTQTHSYRTYNTNLNN